MNIKLIFFITIFLCTSVLAKEYAYYTVGRTKEIDSFIVDGKGIKKEIGYNNNEIKNISINILPGSFDKSSKFFIGINDGSLYLPTGRASSVAIDFRYDQPYQEASHHGIMYPIEFSVEFTSDEMSKKVVIGYVVTADGSLEPCQTYISGKNTFTFVLLTPAIFTWSYVDIE